MRFILCFLSIIASLQAKPLEVVEITARSAILMNADTGAILYEKHAHVPSYPASITKVATALFILDHKKPSLEQMVTVVGDAVKLKPLKKGDYPAYWDEADGTKMGILKGEIVSMESLLHGMMMVSGNDAANAMAASLAPSIPAFIEELNQYIRFIGCRNTQFMNPHGYHHPEHFTTAYDICLITRKALQIPKFREVVGKISYLCPKTNKQPARELRQSNSLLKPGKHYYPKAIGIKTGFHSHAMNNLIAAAEHEGRTLIAVILGCPDRKARYNDAIRLFEEAFAETKQTIRLFGPTHIFTREIEGAKQPLNASPSADVTLTYYPAEEPVYKAYIQWDPLSLSIRKGQKVGEVLVKDEKGQLLASKPLYAREEVTGKFFFVLKENLKGLFR